MIFFATRRTTAIALVASTCFMSSCTLLAPRPNPALVELAQGTTSEELAGQLYDEIERLCGYRDGAVVETCKIDRVHSPSPDPMGLYLSTLEDVPEESKPLVIRQAITVAERDDAPMPTRPITHEGDAALANELLQRHYASAYALESSLAFGSHPDVVEDLIARLKTLEQPLYAVLEQPSPPAAGYTFDPATTPDTIRKNVEDAWVAAAVDAQSPYARTFFILGASKLSRPA